MYQEQDIIDPFKFMKYCMKFKKRINKKHDCEIIGHEMEKMDRKMSQRMFDNLFFLFSTTFIALSLSYLILSGKSSQASNNILNVDGIPAGFVKLRDIDASIIQSLRYCTNENFLGKRIEGYQFDEAILDEPAARALSKVQQDLLAEGFSLVVYDAYRPQKAVDSFVVWSADHSDQKEKEKYYPYIDKKDVFKLGYVMKSSGHTRGDTLDLTIIKITEKLKPVEEKDRILNNGKMIKLLDDGTVDMGTSLDLFGPASHHDTDLITFDHTIMRNYLRNKMAKHSFNAYQSEWWHYTYKPECSLWCKFLKYKFEL